MFLVRFWNWPLLRPQNITICWLRAMFALKELDRKMHVLRALIEWVAILTTYALLCHHFDPAEGRGHHPSPVCITSVGGSSHTWPRRRPPALPVSAECRGWPVTVDLRSHWSLLNCLSDFSPADLAFFFLPFFPLRTKFCCVLQHGQHIWVFFFLFQLIGFPLYLILSECLHLSICPGNNWGNVFLTDDSSSLDPT